MNIGKIIACVLLLAATTYGSIIIPPFTPTKTTGKPYKPPKNPPPTIGTITILIDGNGNPSVNFLGVQTGTLIPTLADPLSQVQAWARYYCPFQNLNIVVDGDTAPVPYVSEKWILTDSSGTFVSSFGYVPGQISGIAPIGNFTKGDTTPSISFDWWTAGPDSYRMFGLSLAHEAILHEILNLNTTGDVSIAGNFPQIPMDWTAQQAWGVNWQLAVNTLGPALTFAQPSLAMPAFNGYVIDPVSAFVPASVPEPTCLWALAALPMLRRRRGE